MIKIIVREAGENDERRRAMGLAPRPTTDPAPRRGGPPGRPRGPRDRSEIGGAGAMDAMRRGRDAFASGRDDLMDAIAHEEQNPGAAGLTQAAMGRANTNIRNQMGQYALPMRYQHVLQVWLQQVFPGQLGMAAGMMLPDGNIVGLASSSIHGDPTIIRFVVDANQLDEWSQDRALPPPEAQGTDIVPAAVADMLRQMADQMRNMAGMRNARDQELNDILDQGAHRGAADNHEFADQGLVEPQAVDLDQVRNAAQNAPPEDQGAPPARQPAPDVHRPQAMGHERDEAVPDFSKAKQRSPVRQKDPDDWWDDGDD